MMATLAFALRVAVVLFTAALLPSSSEAYKILYVSGLGGPGSHFYTGSIIAETLVKRGHQVTFAISDAFGHRANSSLAELFDFEVYPSTVSRNQMREGLRKLGSSSITGEKSSYWEWLKLWISPQQLFGGSSATFESMGINAFFAQECDMALSDSAMIDRLRAAKFDIAVGDILYPCYVLLAQKLNLRYVNVLNGIISPMESGRLAGLPSNPAFMPGSLTKFTTDMSLPQRCLNVLAYGAAAVLQNYIFLGAFDSLKSKHGIKPEMGMFESLGRCEIWLMNTDFAADYPRSLTPNAVLVGGLTTAPAGPLDEELASFVEGSGDHGVVIFTLSSYLNVLPADWCNEMASALARLPQRVVWKYEGEPPATLGNNTKLMKWLPVNDLLGHPKTKALITQGGLNSVMEAIYHGVPFIGIPLTGDQFDILRLVLPRGFAKQVDINTMTGEILHQAIVDVVEDKQYRASALKWSKIMKDQLTSPRDRAANWIELVIKHGGAHLRPKSLDLNIFQLHSIDVILFLITVSLVTSYVTYHVMRITCRRCLACCTKSRKAKRE